MNTFSIHTRTMGKITFSNPAGFVYCDFGNRKRQGSKGRRICESGELFGAMLTATDDDLERKARLWLNAFYKLTDAADRAILRDF